MDLCPETPLQMLCSAIAQAPDEPALKQQVATEMRAYFAANRSSLFFFDQIPLLDQSLRRALEAGMSVEHNPVVRYLLERHAPVHDSLVTPHRVWTALCPRPDHWHVMAGPVVSQGRLVAAVGFTRDRNSPAFEQQNLTDLSALCLHLSSRLAALRAAPVLSRDRLTPREGQIAALVAQGHTNSEIGAALWITENSVKQALKRMFRKLGVSSRAQLVAQLALSSPAEAETEPARLGPV